MMKIDPTSTYSIRRADGKKYIQCDLIADTSAEVIANGTNCENIEGIDDDMILDFGSTAFTMQEKSLLTLDSDSKWY